MSEKPDEFFATAVVFDPKSEPSMSALVFTAILDDYPQKLLLMKSALLILARKVGHIRSIESKSYLYGFSR